MKRCLEKLQSKHGTAKGLSIFAHKLGAVVYHLLRTQKGVRRGTLRPPLRPGDRPRAGALTGPIRAQPERQRTVAVGHASDNALSPS